MAHILEDRILESSTSTGVGPFALTAALTGFRRFNAVCAVSDTVPYFIEAIDSLGAPTGEFEYGIATYSAANQLTRLAANVHGGSSGAGVLVNFLAGSKNVGITLNKNEIASRDTLITRATLTSGTAQATTAGTSVDFTGIPSWVKRITLNLNGVSTNGTDNWLVQLGDSGGVEIAGYSGASVNLANGVSPVTAAYGGTGFVVPSGGAANLVSGTFVFTLLDAAAFLWVGTSILPLTSSANIFVSGGTKALSATLDRIRLTTTGGVNTFDAGSVNILYE